MVFIALRDGIAQRKECFAAKETGRSISLPPVNNNNGAGSKYFRSGTSVNSRVPEFRLESGVYRMQRALLSSQSFPINLSPVIIFFAKSQVPGTSSFLEP